MTWKRSTLIAAVAACVIAAAPASASDFSIFGAYWDTDVAGDAAGGGLAAAYERNSGGGFSGTFQGGSARVLRRFGDQGHEWSNELRFDRNRFVFGFDTEVDQQIPALPLSYETTENRNRQNQIGFTSA